MVGLLALGVFVLVNSAVGLRLLWTATHGGGGPAWSCGLGFTFIGLLGYPLATLAGVGTLPVGEVNHGLGAAGAVFTAAGLASFFAFTLTAFRRTDTWAWVLTGCATVLLAVAAFGQIGALASADRDVPSVDAAHTWMQMTGLLSTLCYAWSGLEGMSEWRRARRRAALGITDPLVANRILLWGLHGVAVTCLNVLLMTLSYRSINLAESVTAQVAMTAIALISSTAITLAFFPTRAWTSWVRVRAQTRTAEA